jgi:hypothetical protein
MGNPDREVEYVVNETGVVKKIGREPTMEEFAAHPFFQGCDFEALGMQGGSGVLNSSPRSERPQPQRKCEKVEESNDPPQTIGVDPTGSSSSEEIQALRRFAEYLGLAL